MTYPARSVAAQLRVRLPGVGVKKLHKLLYYAQGYHLAMFPEPLFEEAVSAWDMGPVVGGLWWAEKDDGIPDPWSVEDQFDEAALNTIGLIVSRYGHLTGMDLEHLTHSESPWMDANTSRKPGTSVRIPVEALRSYFVNIGTDDDDAEPLDDEVVSTWLAPTHGVTSEGRRDSIDELRARLVRSA